MKYIAITEPHHIFRDDGESGSDCGDSVSNLSNRTIFLLIHIFEGQRKDVECDKQLVSKLPSRLQRG